jgi:LPPG:FO 2-phospho-L-lactate transferase
VNALRDEIAGSPAPVVAVSPLVQGDVVKGPTAAFMDWAGQSLNSAGIAAVYDGLLNGLVADTRTDALPVLETDVLMDTPETRRTVAALTLDFALALAEP